MGRRGTMIALGVAVVITAIAATAVLALRPSIPDGAASAAITRTVLTGEAAPFGQECLSRIERAGGWVDLCWAVSRLANDADPAKDYYVLRMYGSHEGLRWLVVRSQIVGIPAGGVYDIWPDGTYTGPCRQEAVSMMIPLGPIAMEDVCGETKGSLEMSPFGHRLAWTCGGCLLADSLTRAVSLYTVVGVPEGTTPAWDLFADAGT